MDVSIDLLKASDERLDPGEDHEVLGHLGLPMYNIT